mmetsp:Transcript_7089/g.19989  ORF Transcript_7089/g.19989 Transcript_7089/m.19989 type:complete len:308 (-) Transcript_7089:317-1240(-)|eukprot:scaffold76202_cov33-Tisochrysis_lutea.AAC.2
MSANLFRYWDYPVLKYMDGMSQAIRRLKDLFHETVSARQTCAATRDPPARMGVGTFLDIMEARVAMGEGRDAGGAGKDLFDQKRLIDNLLTAFLAGTDTTGIALVWMLQQLALDSKLQAECANEAMAVNIEDADESEILARLPTIRSLYWEVNRLFGAAGFLVFEPVEGKTVTLRGRKLLPPSEGGRIAIFTMLTYCNSTKEAGELAGISDPKKFDARRWIQPDRTVKHPPADAYFSFGHGLRTCPGRQLSHLSATVCVATILRAFTLSMPSDHPRVEKITKFTERPDQEIRLLLTPRSADASDARR